MSRTFHDDWGHVLPPLDIDDPDAVRKHQIRAVGLGAQAGYTTAEQRDPLEMLGLLGYVSKPRTDL